MKILFNKNRKLSIVFKLCKNLEKNQIKYCHWKSNAFIHRSSSGENDLDLLVDRSDIQRFTKILYESGFKLAFPSPVQNLPGILNFFGYDNQADKIVHVHAHYRLVIGHDATKNYHIPIEESYIKSAIKSDFFMVPAPEFEMILFIIRMVLKHSTWDAFLNKQSSMSATEHQELKYLLSKISKNKLNELLKIHFSYIDNILFEACICSITEQNNFLFRIKVAQQLQSRLKTQARRTQLYDTILKFWIRLEMGIKGHVFGLKPKNKFSSGGLMVAIVGGDGAGKSTAVRKINDWLSKYFSVKTFHMGKPRWSLITIAVRGILRIGRTLGFYPFMRYPITYTLNKENLVFPGYPWMLREICLARDRYLTYLKARRFASNGFMVICDRFPLTVIKLMDGPQIRRMTFKYKKNFFINLLIKIEEFYYECINLPELLIILKVNPEIAVCRKVSESSCSVRARCSEIWDFDWQELYTNVIDANQSNERVLCEIKDIVWSAI